MGKWRWTLCEQFDNGKTKLEQHSGQREELRPAMEDIAKTVEYLMSKC